MTDKTRLASSEDIPRAVEFLINLVLRGVCLLLAAGCALLAFVAWLSSWGWWPIPLALVMVLLACGFAFRPRGKIVYDRVGPAIIVPKPPE